MSSACVCHTNEWCFYCNMYSPLEKENELLKQGIERLKEIRRNATEAHSIVQTQLVTEIDQLKAEKAALMECVEWYASFWNHDVQLEDIGITSMQRDNGKRARECLANLGGSQCQR